MWTFARLYIKEARGQSTGILKIRRKPKTIGVVVGSCEFVEICIMQENEKIRGRGAIYILGYVRNEEYAKNEVKIIYNLYIGDILYFINEV